MGQTKRQTVGTVGEDVAILFLVKHNFTIIERNYLKKWGEIDIIAEKNKRLHFIEVKSILERPGVTPYDPEENVHRHKQERFRRIIESYLLAKKAEEREYQADVIAIVIHPVSEKVSVRYIPDVTL